MTDTARVGTPPWTAPEDGPLPGAAVRAQPPSASLVCAAARAGFGLPTPCVCPWTLSPRVPPQPLGSPEEETCGHARFSKGSSFHFGRVLDKCTCWEDMGVTRSHGAGGCVKAGLASAGKHRNPTPSVDPRGRRARAHTRATLRGEGMCVVGRGGFRSSEDQSRIRVLGITE